MFPEQIQNCLLRELDLCAYCILRFSNKNSFFEGSFKNTDLDCEIVRKKSKPNICVACLDIFQQIDNVVKEIINETELKHYECSTLCSSIHIPMALLTRDLSIWIWLLGKFPTISNGKIFFFS